MTPAAETGWSTATVFCAAAPVSTAYWFAVNATGSDATAVSHAVLDHVSPAAPAQVNPV